MAEIDAHLLAQAARHVEELDARIARQRLIVARLGPADDQRHAEAARDLLAALETSRVLALRSLRRHQADAGRPLKR